MGTKNILGTKLFSMQKILIWFDFFVVPNYKIYDYVTINPSPEIEHAVSFSRFGFIHFPSTPFIRTTLK